jgi:hypothetical protein
MQWLIYNGKIKGKKVNEATMQNAFPLNLALPFKWKMTLESRLHLCPLDCHVTATYIFFLLCACSEVKVKYTLKESLLLFTLGNALPSSNKCAKQRSF